MAKKTEAYVDTSALIAFLDRSDSYHSLFVGLFSDPPCILTTSLVIAEGHGWFLKRYDAFRALQFMAFIEELRSLEIVEIGQKQLADATKVLRRFSDQDLTLADACGLSLMEKRKIRRCWSTDFHLGLTGVPLIIHA
ncbi:MAG: type II toxin-antitoxin system VapC family toxin [Deltaproteobacteria bacterium]|nr:type II toxin-antitoxin system VapC family toxin [Deltaproteobacteria bacterium]